MALLNTAAIWKLVFEIVDKRLAEMFFYEVVVGIDDSDDLIVSSPDGQQRTVPRPMGSDASFVPGSIALIYRRGGTDVALVAFPPPTSD